MDFLGLSGQSPFLGETLAHTYCNVEKGRWMFCEEFRENGISDDAKDFISRLLIVEKELSLGWGHKGAGPLGRQH
uniref:Uncharacterized protein n=1 Tax=Meloidogyne incognita TaxID=6306 RepID=A0A914LQJ6_MELIC